MNNPQLTPSQVTGGSGKLGRSVVSLLSRTHEVISLDVRRPPTATEDGKGGLDGAYRLVEVDLEDMGAVLETFMSTDMAYAGGIAAVVHLAALPSPGQTNASRQFRVNTMSTYNVLEAARKVGVRNVVLASSETLIGIPLAEVGLCVLFLFLNFLLRMGGRRLLLKPCGGCIEREHVIKS